MRLKFWFLWFNAIFLIFHSARSSAAEIYDEAVSLGSICQVAQQLNQNGIRHHSYPFDWIVTSMEGITKFIVNQGAGFLDQDHLILSDKWPLTNCVIVFETFYKFHLLHDFEDPFEISYEPVKAKFKRRIKRFFDLLTSNKKILFVRLAITRQEAELFDQVLQDFYPCLSYTIVAVNEYAQDWGMERVKNFQVNQVIPFEWVGNNAKWKEILNHFQVQHASNPPPFWSD